MNQQKKAILFLSLSVLFVITAAACSLNRALPSEVDKPAMEADVRAAIASAVPGKTFAIQVDVMDGGAVKLSGHVDDQSDKDAIVSKVQGVKGVMSVDASGLTVG
jgi:osmotically-inducible protein OsmY